MNEKILASIRRITKPFLPEDFDELIKILKEDMMERIQQLKEEQEREAAKILLSNLDTLLKNKDGLPENFVKQIEKLSGKKEKKDEGKKVTPPSPSEKTNQAA
ncbi:MAG: DUF4175 domain-containing protein [Proteobacteria bacterium]|nr:DUF4175 domain-containing protein [Pseudomonadota bacterium]